MPTDERAPEARDPWTTPHDAVEQRRCSEQRAEYAEMVAWRNAAPEAREGWDQLQALVGSVEGPPDLSARYTHPEALEELRSGLAEYDYHGYGYIKLDPQHARTILALLSERPESDLATAAYLLGRHDRRSDAEPGAPCRQCGGPTVRRTTRGSPDGEREYDLCERCGWVQPVGDDAGGEREPDAWVLVDQAERLLAGVFGDTSWGRDVGLWRARVDEARALRPAAEGGS